MNAPPREERWPPTYDAEQLAGQIKALAESGRLFKQFYSSLPDDGSWCQGDIVCLKSDFPYLDEDGMPAVLENHGIEFWLLLSNTCDMDRSLADVPYVQLVPLLDIPVSASDLAALRRYEYSRRFYLPGWSTSTQQSHYVAELTMPITADRQALTRRALPQAHLTQLAWILLHSCLVRFLARDDGRYDLKPEVAAPA